MPRFDIRYRYTEIRALVSGAAEVLAADLAAAMTTDDPKGAVLPRYVKLELTPAPDDINTCDININVSARALPGRIGREPDIARAVRGTFVEATGGRYSVGVWVTLEIHSAYRERRPS